MPDAARAAKVEGSRGEEKTALQSVFDKDAIPREERSWERAGLSCRGKGRGWDWLEEAKDIP